MCLTAMMLARSGRGAAKVRLRQRRALVYLTRYGRRVGAVVPAEVAERFKHGEDLYWSRRAAEVLDRNKPTLPWEEAARLVTAHTALGTPQRVDLTPNTAGQAGK